MDIYCRSRCCCQCHRDRFGCSAGRLSPVDAQNPRASLSALSTGRRGPPRSLCTSSSTVNCSHSTGQHQDRREATLRFESRMDLLPADAGHRVRGPLDANGHLRIDAKSTIRWRSHVLQSRSVWFRRSHVLQSQFQGRLRPTQRNGWRTTRKRNGWWTARKQQRFVDE